MIPGKRAGRAVFCEVTYHRYTVCMILVLWADDPLTTIRCSAPAKKKIPRSGETELVPWFV